MNNVAAPALPPKDRQADKSSSLASSPAPRSAMAGTTAAPASAGQPSRSSSLPSQLSQQPAVDFVLVFQAVPKRYLKVGKVPSAQKGQISREYQKIVERIEDVGLSVTSREGTPKSGQVLLFVRGHDSALVKIGKEEGLIDYLHGVRTPFEPASSSLGRSSSLPKGSTHSLAISQFSPADRLRHIYTLLTLPATPATSDGITRRGAGLTIKSEEFPHLVDMTPLHDEEYNKRWLTKWGSSNSVLSISISDLDEIRQHFGEHIAFYFGFLLYYFQSLASIAAVGGAFWITGSPYHPIYSLALVFWACFFVESWRIKERKLAVRWGTLGCSEVDTRRLGYKPLKKQVDKVTGEEVEVFEWWRRELRVAGSIPAIIFFAGLLGLTLTTMFITEVFVARLYDGPGKKLVPLVPTALFSVCIPQIMAAWQATAHSLTNWENHFSQRGHEWSMTVKMFALQAFVAYGALTLSAFVYIPFGQTLMDTIVSRGYFAKSIAEAVASGNLQLRSDGGLQFEINPDRMHSQLFAVLTTSQAINAFTEVGLPFILRKVAEWRAGETNVSATTGQTATQEKRRVPDEAEQNFLKKVHRELALPAYDTFGDYAEMATQFGYIALWSVIWPLAPLGGLINNFFELRGDALKVCLNARRSIPLRTDSVGPWLEILGFIAWLAAMSNSALVYLYQRSPHAHLPGHSAYEATMRTHVHPGGGLDGLNASTIVSSYFTSSDATSRSPLSLSRFLPTFLPTSGASGAMMAAILVALASEHGYALVRSGLRHVLERALWRGSEEEITLKRREWEAKREAVGKHRINEGEMNRKVQKRSDEEEETEGFWSSSRNVGMNVVMGKTE